MKLDVQKRTEIASSARFRLLGLAVAGVLAGCSGGHQPSAQTSTRPAAIGTPSSPVAFAVTSGDLASGHWPSADTCDGGDDVPDLHWTAGPLGTQSYALQLFDSDTANRGFTHWMLANEPPNVREPTPNTGVSGKNDFGHEGYNGPCPPKGSTHHYVFTVYAVDTMLSLRLLYSHADFQKALQAHVLRQATLTATYGR